MKKIIQSFPKPNKAVELFDEVAKGREQTDFQNALAKMVYDCYREARDFRQMSGIEDRMMRDLRARRGVYNPDELACIEKGEDVYYPITNLKIRAGEAWLTDIYEKAEDQLITLEPTPIPDLAPALEEVVIDSLEQEFIQRGVEGEDVTQIAQNSKDLAINHQTRLAVRNAKNHERLIRDQLEEGNFNRVFRDFRSDFFTFPKAIIKGPVLRPKEQLNYDLEGNVILTRKVIPCFERVSPFDFFPSPDACGTQPDDSSYVIHRIRACKRDIWKLAIMQGSSIEAINQIFSSQPEGHYDCEQTFGQDLGSIQKDKSNQNKTPFYELLMYYGRVPGRMLLEHSDIKGISPNMDYEAHICMSGGTVIRAMLNPYPRNMRPFHGTGYHKNVEGWWDTSMPEILEDVQRKASAAVRSLVKNMAHSAGFITEVDTDSLKDDEDIEDMSPGRILERKRGRNSALTFHRMPSVARDMIQLQRQFNQEADDLSGIPAYVLGNPGQSAPPRTTGVLALLLGGASRIIKHSVSNIDKDVLEPAFLMIYDLNMKLSSDPAIKADAVPRARGASGIVERDLKQQRKLEFLQIMNGAQNVKQEGIDSIYRQLAEDFGFDADAFFDDPQRAAELGLRAGLLQTGGLGGLGGEVLDGRNQSVVTAGLGGSGLPI